MDFRVVAVLVTIDKFQVVGAGQPFWRPSAMVFAHDY